MREDMHLETTTYARSPAFLYRRVSWGAIFAGLFVTLVIQLMLTLLGVTIGAATINPLEEQDPARGLAIGSGIWLLVTGLISMFIGAYVAGRLSGGPRPADGLLHGLVTWSVATLVTVYMVVSAAGNIMGGLGTLVSGALGGGAAVGAQRTQQGQQGQGQAGQALGQIREQISQAVPEADAILPPTGREGSAAGQEPGSLTALAAQDTELAAALARLQRAGGANAAPQERDQVVNILSTKHGIEQQQAANMVTQWDQNFQQAKAKTEEKAREVGQTTAEGVSKGALWGFIALALGCVIAALGGWVGTRSLPSRLETIPAPAV